MHINLAVKGMDPAVKRVELDCGPSETVDKKGCQQSRVSQHSRIVTQTPLPTDGFRYCFGRRTGEATLFKSANEGSVSNG